MATKKKTPQQSLPLHRWLLPTNHYNLMSWLSAGMLLPGNSMEKYYPDCTSTAAGWIPVFLNALPQKACDAAVAKSGYLAVVELDLKGLSGGAMGVTKSGELIEFEIERREEQEIVAVLITAPLPSSSILSVLFAKAENREAFVERCDEISNIPSDLFNLVVGEIPISTRDLTDTEYWPPQNLPQERPALDLNLISAEGAIASLLYSFGNSGDSAIDLWRSFFESFGSNLNGSSSAFRAGMDQLMAVGLRPVVAELRSKLFWGVVSNIISPLVINGQKTETGYAVLHYLEQESTSESSKSGKLQELITDLRGTSGLASYSHKELFEKHPGPFSHALLLFFLRKHCDELLEFQPRDFELSTTDRIAAAILFGARDGWSGIPKLIREANGLYASMTHLMCKTLQVQSVGSINLGSGPGRCKPIRELLLPTDGTLSKRQSEGSLALARAKGWSDAVETKIRLGKGDYRLEVGSSGLTIVIPGDVRSVETVAVPNILLDHLARALFIDSKVESEVRKIVGNGVD